MPKVNDETSSGDNIDSEVSSYQGIEKSDPSLVESFKPKTKFVE